MGARQASIGRLADQAPLGQQAEEVDGVPLLGELPVVALRLDEAVTLALGQ